MGFKARKRPLKVGDIVAVRAVEGHWPADKWVETGFRICFQPIMQINEVGDVPHQGEADACIQVDIAGEEETKPRGCWMREAEMTLAIPVEKAKLFK